MSRRKLWMIFGVVSVLAGGVLTGVVGTRAALGAAEEAVGPKVPAFLAERPLGKMLAGGLHRLRQLHGELDITPEQREQIKAVLQAHRGEIVQVARKLRDEHRELRSVVEAEPVNETAIREAAADLGEVLGDAAVLHAEIRGEVVTVLTPEQVAKLEACRQDFDAHIDKALDAAEK
jgi:Spy/CpxP family protein refolding chaperone